jgi:hypothetical protein
MTARVLPLLAGQKTERQGGGDDLRSRYFAALCREVAATSPLYFQMKVERALSDAVGQIARELPPDAGVELLVGLAKHLERLEQWIADVERQIGPREPKGGA